MFRILITLVCIGSFSMNAQALTVSGDDTDCVSPRAHCWTTNVNGSVSDQDAFSPLLDGLTLFYKDDTGGAEGGSNPGSYTTVYDVEADPTAATISYDSGDTCGPVCYLLVKDGSADPTRYLFDVILMGWNGTDDLDLEEFWTGIGPLGAGAISHVSLYSGVSAVPVPAAVWLFGTALIGFIGMSRRTKV